MNLHPRLAQFLFGCTLLGLAQFLFGCTLLAGAMHGCDRQDAPPPGASGAPAAAAATQAPADAAPPPDCTAPQEEDAPAATTVAQQPPGAEADAWLRAIETRDNKDRKPELGHAAAAPLFEAFAAAHPASPRMPEARVEAGNSWINVAFGLRNYGRTNAQADAAFAKARTHLDWAALNAPEPFKGRAAYLLGNSHYFGNDLAAAEAQYTRVVDAWPVASEWARRSLERRSEVRRHRLDYAGAVADLELYLKRYSALDKERTGFLTKTLAQTRALGKPAPAFTSTDWIQGAAAPLDSLLGDVVVVYFFSTQCGFCDAQRDQVADWAAHLEGKVRFVGMLVPQQDHATGKITEPLQIARQDVGRKGFAFPVVYDHNLRSAMQYLGSKPDMVVIDRLGNLRWHDSPKNLQPQMLAKLLEE